MMDLREMTTEAADAYRAGRAIHAEPVNLALSILRAELSMPGARDTSMARRLYRILGGTGSGDPLSTPVRVSERVSA